MYAGNPSQHLRQLSTREHMRDGSGPLTSVYQLMPVFAWSLLTDTLAPQRELESDLRSCVAGCIYDRDYVRAFNRKVG